MRKGLLALIGASLCFLSSITADARPHRVNQIPNGAVFSCLTCHNSTAGGTRNLFGRTVEGSFLTGSGASANVVWNTLLASLDSDGDGFSNGRELGDPGGTGLPNSGAVVSNPGDPASAPPNKSPKFEKLDEQIVRAGEGLTLSVVATDEDGDAISYEAIDLPEGAEFSDGEFSWTPGFEKGGMEFQITIIADDGREQTSLSITITVERVSEPVFSVSVESLNFGSVFLGSSRTLKLKVTNAVDGAGKDLDVRTFSDSPIFSVLDTSLSVPAGEEGEISILYQPVETVEAQYELTLTTNDPEQGRVNISLVGNAQPPLSEQIADSDSDFDGDGMIDLDDFFFFAGAFGGTDPLYDLNKSGKVDFEDFFIFAVDFGKKAMPS